MRDRKEIEEFSKADARDRANDWIQVTTLSLMLEVLLDIRELLTPKPSKREAGKQ